LFTSVTADCMPTQQIQQRRTTRYDAITGVQNYVENNWLVVWPNRY